MSSKAPKPDAPIPQIKHTVRRSNTGIIYVSHIHKPFMQAMAYLFPQFASYDKAEKGYSAFMPSGEFIGCFAGRTLQSVRRNPYLQEKGNQWFVRALLGGLWLDGHRQHQSVCSAQNYGTLRLWQKLGLGAKLDKVGKARTTGYSVGRDTLQSLLDSIDKDNYIDIRNSALRRAEGLDKRVILPDVAALQQDVCARLDVAIEGDQL